MKEITRFQFNAFLTQVASLYGVEVQALSSKIEVSPSIAQKLEDNIQQSAAFLRTINVVPVDEQSGQVIGLGVGSTVASTTDTSKKERATTDPSALTEISYQCQQTNFDTSLPYKKLDLWAKFQDFQLRIRNAIIRRQALDRIMIGFNGTHRAKDSDRVANKLLQDINIGWLQKVRNDAPEHVVSDVKDEAGNMLSKTIRVGVDGDFHNLDALVMSAIDDLIDEEYQDDTEIVVICGRKLLSDKYFPLVNKEQENSEKLAADIIISQKRIGGLQAVRAPYFPENALFITRLDNLSIYWQEKTRRRHILDNPKRDQIENYESVNEAYVVEDYRGVALIENIEMLTPAKKPSEQDADKEQDGA
ncbi:phage major capsid protein, P2 family [Arsenophonus apicola]|uniref:Phage major capsid protein, P2 family n=1 Tax=Arsenophonus apicola TaxID=2879119 RepID=A0ABY8P632_9GAMM|nr:phage major capsid protein, P2 family [Arsenophonus apicola]WGO84682.1 phage major capsid protein, P2 family [Arsenophonus apicola]